MALGGPASTASAPSTLSFEKSLRDFKNDLKKKKDIKNFQMATIYDLKRSIVDIQAKQHCQRRQRHLKRLEPFLEAMEQLGNVVQVFCNANEIVAFVYGPIKFLLQTASTYAEAFSELLDVYEQIGHALPLLAQYENLFRTKPHMVKIVELMYKDILDLHRLALRYFQQPLWRQMFAAAWKTHKSQFSNLINRMPRHRELIESHANVSQIEEFRNLQASEEIRFATEQENEDLRRLQAVYSWLKPAIMDDEQYKNLNTRANYPGTGHWLLEHSTFKDWFSPQYPAIPTLLWLNGKPGAGKTILSSLVIEESQKLNPAPTVLFFYFKYGDPLRNNFLSVARSLLAQLLRQEKDLLHHIYPESCSSGQDILSSRKLTEDLLKFALENCRSAYIILDGLDECPREEIKVIVTWFRELIENLPPTDPDRLRCLFVSQDNSARKDFSGLANVTIGASDVEDDIEEFSRVQSKRLKEKLTTISDQRVNEVARSVAASAEGMFLFAKLIWINLLGQSSEDSLERELRKKFPMSLDQAYSRIMETISSRQVRAEREDAMMLLGWLACAKRPLKWHEIQTMKSIDLKYQIVDFDRCHFQVNPTELCESLVELRPDGTLELVHLTARDYLINNSGLDGSTEEIKLATLCINYLNFPSLTDTPMKPLTPTDDIVLSGEYGFVDYAVLNWVRHLEAGLALNMEKSNLLPQLMESLDVFLAAHWRKPSGACRIPKRITEMLEVLKNFEDCDRLGQVIFSTKKQLKHFGEVRKEEYAHDLADVVAKIRTQIELLMSGDNGPSNQVTLRPKYGKDLFKCPRFSCHNFTQGFSSESDRRKHIERHERPARCTDENCSGYIIGFATEVQLAKHLKETHAVLANQDQEFPTEEEIAMSIRTNTEDTLVNDPSIEPSAQPSDTQEPELEPELELESESESESVSDTAPVQRKRQITIYPKCRKLQREHTCLHCGKTFNKQYNWKSHLATHGPSERYECSQCDRVCARKSDLIRHVRSHVRGKTFICGGVLIGGKPWGCGNAFTRADILRSHHKSKKGQKCLMTWQQEQDI